MERKTKVSIIIPIYKVEDYIGRCIKSIQKQDYENLEIIVVDDGSPDKSGKIVDEIALKDTRIIVVHKDNAGVSTARNSGIQIATGNYIMFVDGDDWVDRSYVSDFVRAAEQNSYDIVMNYNYFADNGYPRYSEDNIVKRVYRDSAAECIYNGKIFVAVWNKLYRRKFLIENHIKFHEDIWFGEGMLYNIECISKVKSLGVLNKAIYHQELNPDSAMRKFNLSSYECGLRSMRLQKTIIEEFGPKVIDAWKLHNYQYNMTIIDGLVRTNTVDENIDTYNKHISELRRDIWIPLTLERRFKAKLKWLAYYIAPRMVSKIIQNRHQKN